MQSHASGVLWISFSPAILNVVLRSLLMDFLPQKQLGEAFALAAVFSQSGLMLGYATTGVMWGKSGYFKGLVSASCDESKGLCLELRVAMFAVGMVSFLGNLLVCLAATEEPAARAPERRKGSWRSCRPH